MLPHVARSIMALTLTFLVSLLSTSVAQAHVLPRPQLAASPYDLINAVNAVRASYGMSPYLISPILMAVAQSHADYMAATGSVSHTGAGGSSVTDRLLAAGYPLAGDLTLGGFRSENITSGSEDASAQTAVNQWTGDALHLNTMISPNLTEIGAGVTVNGGRVYFVIDCAQPTNIGALPTAGASIEGASTVAPAGGVIIPVIVVTANSQGDVIHEVKAGQTLWQIAISYDTTIDTIKQLNNLFDNEIYPGTRLLVKRGVAVTPAFPTQTTTLEAASRPVSVPSLTAVVSSQTSTPMPVSGTSSASRNKRLGIAMGIVALALLGGGIMAWTGKSSTRQNIG